MMKSLTKVDWLVLVVFCSVAFASFASNFRPRPSEHDAAMRAIAADLERDVNLAMAKEGLGSVVANVLGSSFDAGATVKFKLDGFKYDVGSALISFPPGTETHFEPDTGELSFSKPGDITVNTAFKVHLQLVGANISFSKITLKTKGLLGEIPIRINWSDVPQ